jgi:predicted GNAT superfamily acetyltransferase
MVYVYSSVIGIMDVYVGIGVVIMTKVKVNESGKNCYYLLFRWTYRSLYVK